MIEWWLTQFLYVNALLISPFETESLWLTFGCILEKQRMGSTACGFRFKVHCRAVLWLRSGLSHLTIIYQPQVLVVRDRILLKKKTPVFFKITFYQLQLICSFKRQANIIKASFIYGELEFLGTGLLSGLFLRFNDTWGQYRNEQKLSSRSKTT